METVKNAAKDLRKLARHALVLENVHLDIFLSSYLYYIFLSIYTVIPLDGLL